MSHDGQRSGGVTARLPLCTLALAALLGACGRKPAEPAPTAVPAPGAAPVVKTAASPAAPPPPEVAAADVLPEKPQVPVARRAIQVVKGQEHVVDADDASARGLTIVDLSDSWAPVLFDDGRAPDGAILPNRYRTIFVGAANDKIDGDGVPLEPGVKNHLELFGIPPSLAVLRERFLAVADKTCDRDTDVATLLAVDGVETWGSTTEKKELTNHRLRGLRLEAKMKTVGAATLEDLAQKEPRYARDVKQHRRFEAERKAFTVVEGRLACEGLMDAAKHKAGLFDTPMRHALVDFQLRHAVMDVDIHKATLEALARPLAENEMRALRRVLTERAVHSGGLLEDGSVQPPAGGKRKRVTYPTKAGGRAEVPDLVTPAVDAVFAALGIGGPADAVAFFRRHPAADFGWLRVAARFAETPEYHTPNMELSAEIDRGDVWYDFPYDEKGEKVSQTRRKYPTFTLFAKILGERVPLVRWRTTIGGWRAELAEDGQEYFRYKNSDVGPRVWRHVVAAPVWIPPRTNPVRGLVKEKRINGSSQLVTNYDETGPGYFSAYGVAAAIHVKVGRGANGPTYHDNGIRTHGSSDYLSLRGRFSHGCHRLYNNLALRLFSFVLRHRPHKALGQAALGFRQTFYWKGEVFDLRLPTRGFYYELEPPLPIETLEGTIRGKLKDPITNYLKKPGVEYDTDKVPPAPDSPEAKAGGG